jgi:hypothetical protein
MALVFINGFDDQLSSGVSSGTSMSFDLSTVRTGTASGRIQGVNGASNTGYFFLPIPGGGDATIVVGQALYLPNNVNSCAIATFLSDNGSTVHVTVGFKTSTGVLTVYRGGSGGTVLGTVTLSGTALLPTTWGYWETKCVLSDTVGEVHVRYNGAAVLDLTGLDTKNAGTKTVIDSVAYPSGFGDSAYITYIDDFYVVTGTGPSPTDFLGDCKVSTIYPSGNGDFSQLVGSDADSVNNYALVNEVGAPVTTSYVESDTVGQRDFYAMGDIVLPSSATVLGVQVSAYCNNPDGGASRSAKLGIRQGTNEALSANQALTTATFLAARGVFTVDPATGTAWTQAGVNSVQAGVEVS